MMIGGPVCQSGHPLTLAEKLSALRAEDYLKMRARRGDRRRFEEAMRLVSDVESEEQGGLLREDGR